MDLVFLVLSILLKVLRMSLPWIMAFILTTLIMSWIKVNERIFLPIFLFSFFYIGFFLRDEAFPLIFKNK